MMKMIPWGKTNALALNHAKSTEKENFSLCGVSNDNKKNTEKKTNESKRLKQNQTKCGFIKILKPHVYYKISAAEKYPCKWI